MKAKRRKFSSAFKV